MTDDFDATSLGVLDGSLKGFPPASVGLDAAGFLAAKPALDGFTTPLVTLDQSAVIDNVETMRRWCEHAGVGLAPHGKTTMNRALWQRQLDAGSWGITVATPWQLAVAIDWSIPSVMLANALVQPEHLRAVARALDADTAHIVVWADSVRAVQIMSRVLAEEQPGRPLHVLVELGAPGGRTGARDHATALEIAEAVVAAPELALAGVSGYEGALAHHGDDGSLAIVRDYLESLAAFHTTLLDAGRYDERVETVIVTAGGSAYFDIVAEVLAGLRDLDGANGRPVDVLLRSGAYITHDDGFYRGITPLARHEGTGDFRSAIHGWATIVSRPEPGLALIDGGKRDFPFDEGLPEVQGVRRAGSNVVEPLTGATATAMNDQHTFIALPPGSDLEVGDVIRLGLSHPCTTFDKWRALIVIDDVRADEPRAVDAVTTTFG
ncbi:MAG TPA: amino acid deaminase [Plantibacter sp.]|uniref:amino acid deaminase n=1 Tax=unclassified Plantibacter TaxID=2624265 RepID=UPI002C0EE64C|nr:amino acid deaminase [Plantibacter sp.]